MRNEDFLFKLLTVGIGKAAFDEFISCLYPACVVHVETRRSILLIFLEKPENQNILFPNKKENKIKIFKDNKWVYKDKVEVINDLIDGKYFILDCHYEDVLKDKFNKYNKKIYETFRDLFDVKDVTLHEQLKKECELMLLNNR